MYHLFVGEHYYPSGGMGDYCGVFPTLDAVKDRLRSGVHPLGWEWAEVATINAEGALEEVASFERGDLI